MTGVARSGDGWRVANEPFSQSPFVFEEQDASEFREPVGAVLEGAENGFPVADSEHDDTALVVVGVFEDFGCVVEPFRAEALGEFEYEAVRDRKASEEHVLDSSIFGPPARERAAPLPEVGAPCSARWRGRLRRRPEGRSFLRLGLCRRG